MTTVCSGGASAPKAGVPSSLVVDQQYIQSILPTPLNWLYPYLPYMHGLQIGDVGAFCATDPPTWSVPTSDQIYNFLTGGPIGDYNTVNQFLQDITRAYLWYSACECSSVSTPAPPSPPSAPVGLPSVNPPVLVGPAVGQPCAVLLGGPMVYAGGGNTGGLIPFTDFGGSHNDDVMFPSGATNVRIITTLSTGTSSTGNVEIVVNFFDSDQGAFGGAGGNDPVVYFETIGHTTTTDVVLVAPIGGVQINIEWSVAAGTNALDARIEVYCGGPPGATQSPCCPPDQISIGLLTQIYQLLTLQQRQSTPFAYIDGASHSSLTGFGEISVQGLIGLKLTITDAGPGVLGVAAGDPETVWQAGWYRWGNADGWGPREFISSTDVLDLPTSAGVYTKIGYSLNATVEVTITELEREA